MIPAFITHLQGNTPSFTTVANARTLQPDNANPDQLPALFAFRDAGHGNPSSCSPKISQQIFRTISVYLVCNHTQHDQLEKELFDRAIGWQFNPNWSALEFADDKIAGLNGEIIWHQYNFSTWHKYRQ